MNRFGNKPWGGEVDDRRDEAEALKLRALALVALGCLPADYQATCKTLADVRKAVDAATDEAKQRVYEEDTTILHNLGLGNRKPCERCNPQQHPADNTTLLARLQNLEAAMRADPWSAKELCAEAAEIRNRLQQDGDDGSSKPKTPPICDVYGKVKSTHGETHSDTSAAHLGRYGF